jgi:hypothetical protein
VMTWHDVTRAARDRSYGPTAYICKAIKRMARCDPRNSNAGAISSRMTFPTAHGGPFVFTGSGRNGRVS